VGRDNRSTAQIADAIAYVCENIGPIRTTLAVDPEGMRRFEELLAALRDGTDPVDLLEDVHRALRRAGDALGVFGRNRAGSLTTLAGIDRDRHREPVLLCPRADPCARYAWPGDAETMCDLTNAPLRRARLAP
jgi:hypothetical protein